MAAFEVVAVRAPPGTVTPLLALRMKMPDSLTFAARRSRPARRVNEGLSPAEDRCGRIQIANRRASPIRGLGSMVVA